MCSGGSLRHGVHCLQWRDIVSRSALFAVACYCVTECTVYSGVILRYGVHCLQWRDIALRSALFAVACFFTTECTVSSGVLLQYSLILSLNEKPACALPVRPYL